jgi:methylmalonyl-CoA mutase
VATGRPLRATMTKQFTLADGFTDPDIAVWQELAQKALKGAPFERLIDTTFDGIKIQPLYTIPHKGPAATLKLSVRDQFLPWDIRQPFGASDITAVNAEILTDLSGGVSSIELLIGGTTQTGLGVDDISEALSGVLFNLAPVALNGGVECVNSAKALDRALRAANADPALARPAFNLELFSPWLTQGGLPDTFEAMMGEAASLGAELAARWPQAKIFGVSGRAGHEMGASAAQELAVMLACGVAQLRAGEAAGLSPQRIAEVVLLRLGVGQDVIPEIAKLRAARLLWDQILSACGAEGQAASLHAITSRRMLTKNDAWTNVVRVTCATFAAAAGGADVITALPLTTALGKAGPLARRIARNTQIVLMEETHLGHVADPGAGSFAIEALTTELCAAAWAIFQHIEAIGGIAGAVRSGWLQEQIGKSATAQAKDVARRKRPITGVSNHPMPREVLPEFTPHDPPRHAKPVTDLITAVPWTRLSEPFEALRARGEAAGSPSVFFANLGEVSQFAARAGFARNLLAVAGLSTPDSERAYPDLTALTAAFAASGAKVAIICSSDGVYAQQAAPCARALKQVGCAWVMLAGKPVEGAAGVDHYISAGEDVFAALGQIFLALEVT